MSYKCEICEGQVSAGQPVKRHVVKRPDNTIEREVKVCGDCAAGLKTGYTLQEMILMRAPVKGQPTPLRHLPKMADQNSGPQAETV